MWANEVNAQSGLTPSEYNALVAAVETTTPTSASLAPPVGSFYTVTHGEGWPPLPADTLGLDFWDLGGNYYLLDDRSYNYSARWANSSIEVPSPTNGGSGGGDDSGPDLTPQSYSSSDLWLQITNLIGSNATLLIHPPTGITDGVYDVLYATNLTQPILWQWFYRTAPGQTNLTVSVTNNSQTFYRLGPPNYWLAFPDMYSDGYNSLSLYISSAITASGTVTIRGQSNGPTVVVTGTGDDPAVNGTYVLTNIVIYTTNYAGFEGLLLHDGVITNAYVNGAYAIFYDENQFDNMGWALADTGASNVLYAGQYGAHNFNDVSWTYVNDGDIFPPTTSCTEYTLSLPFTVAASNVAIVPVPDDVMVGDYNTIGTNNAIEVNATAAVSVYGIEYDPQATAAFTAYPMTLLGTNYCVMARAATLPFSGYHSEATIVSTENDTMVVISPSSTANLSGLFGPGPFTNWLQQGQTYQIKSADNNSDVTGTVIVSDKPIAVFAGANVAYVPDSNTQSGNPLVQEQIPTNEWGDHFFALSFVGRTNGASYRVLAGSDDTTISISGKILTSTNESSFPYTVTTSNETVTITTNANKFYDFGADGPVEIQANKPVQVAELANGAYFDQPVLPLQLCDPFEILVLPTNLWSQTNVVFSLPSNGTNFVNGYVNIIAPQSAETNIHFDGMLLGTTNFIATNGFCFAQVITTNSGAHTVTSSLPIEAGPYGWGTYDSYGFVGGIPK